jgi:hypothetical protein
MLDHGHHPFTRCFCVFGVKLESTVDESKLSTATGFLEFWKRKNNELVYEWGMDDYEEEVHISH